ncbi:MerR family DNA-binding transcriptional regulator [Christensenellaceae bacterium OttesenSCG-928-M15]|nr:MerR family DNA-binding transcriptional regulator [Christensenellaceae bacterium OttesenSCG-928-M15]
MLTIGEFSRICFVTKKTLRHYDEIGVLRPKFTADNGYRITGALFDRYVRGDGECPPEENVTEIYMPIEKQ